MILPFVLAGLRSTGCLPADAPRRVHAVANPLRLLLPGAARPHHPDGRHAARAGQAARAERRSDRVTGLLYGINTVGAVVGTAVAGFWLIPALGMQISTGIAIAFNLAVTGLAFIIQRAMVRAQAAAPAVPETAGAGPLELHAASVKRGALLVYAMAASPPWPTS